jgi:hypothetical protein
MSEEGKKPCRITQDTQNYYFFYIASSSPLLMWLLSDFPLHF